MQDTELYQQILGLEAPWAVTAVRLDLKAKVVEVWVDHEEGMRWRCPECDASLATYDHVEERTWRHLDTCHLMTLLHAKTPRVACPQARGQAHPTPVGGTAVPFHAALRVQDDRRPERG